MTITERRNYKHWTSIKIKYIITRFIRRMENTTVHLPILNYREYILVETTN